MKNPIYIEYYSHDKDFCYKIDLPYTDYSSHTMVLCKVSDGFETAKRIAEKKIIENIRQALGSGEVENRGD